METALTYRKYMDMVLFSGNQPVKRETESGGNLMLAEGADRESRLRRIMERYGNGLFRYAYSFVGNGEDSEDIVQDTLIQYLRFAPVFENDAHEKAWLFRVAGNISRNRIGYNKRHRTEELEDNVRSHYEVNELSFVWDAVKSLDPKYREVIHLYYYEGHTTREMAEILMDRESTVRSRLLRARKQLKKLLKEEYDFE